jgi:hypothetical protein
MEVRKRNIEIVNLHNIGVALSELSTKFNLDEKVISNIIRYTATKYVCKEGYFNVYELDCWIVPAKENDEYYN